MLVYVIYTTSKIHGVYTQRDIADNVLSLLKEKAGVNALGIPKRFYKMKCLELDKIPGR